MSRSKSSQALHGTQTCPAAPKCPRDIKSFLVFDFSKYPFSNRKKIRAVARYLNVTGPRRCQPCGKKSLGQSRLRCLRKRNVVDLVVNVRGIF